MGDNFGPEFGSSIQEEKRNTPCALNADPKEDLPQALYKDDLRIAKEVGCDNVGNFLLSAGYRSLVPGREDFMYGSGWLRMMAAGFRTGSSDADRKGPSSTQVRGAAQGSVNLAPGPSPNQVSNGNGNPVLSVSNNDEQKLTLLAANVRLHLKASEEA
jgi:hypothetical protein